MPALATTSSAVGSSSSTLAGSTSSATLGGGGGQGDTGPDQPKAAVGFSYKPDESVISKIKKDCERKEEFLKNTTYPAYLSSPPKDIDTSPYGIASLATTMPPPKSETSKLSVPAKETIDFAPGKNCTN